MNKNEFSVIINEINSISSQIIEKKIFIDDLLKENEQKKDRNYLEYNKRFDELDKKTTSIKLLIDNKFRFSKYIDFIDSRDILELKNFDLNTDLGCVVKKANNIIEVLSSKKIIDINNKKITYIYDDPSISNSIKYSFYASDSGLPLTPISIKVTYKDNEDDLFEPHFRYYNRNNSLSFENTFLFEPKKINKVVFEFDKDVNGTNALCKLYSTQYSLEDNYMFINVENPYNIKNFNISKKTNELVVPLVFEYSEDNSNFKTIEFKNGEGIISLEQGKAFTIKAYADNSSIDISEEYEAEKMEIYSEDIKGTFGKYIISDNEVTNLNNIRVIFPLSTYNKIKEDTKSLSNVNLSEIINYEDGVYYLKNDYIKSITDISDDINSLKYIDDISILESDLKYFSFYVNSATKNIYCSSFMNDYPFFITFSYEKLMDKIDEMYYTAYIFELSIKG